MGKVGIEGSLDGGSEDRGDRRAWMEGISDFGVGKVRIEGSLEWEKLG